MTWLNGLLWFCMLCMFCTKTELLSDMLMCIAKFPYCSATLVISLTFLTFHLLHVAIVPVVLSVPQPNPCAINHL